MSDDSERVVSLESRRKAAASPCPICGKPAQPAHRPFCSKRCGDIDLGRWLKGGYRIETDEAPTDGDVADEDERH